MCISITIFRKQHLVDQLQHFDFAIIVFLRRLKVTTKSNYCMSVELYCHLLVTLWRELYLGDFCCDMPMFFSVAPVPESGDWSKWHLKVPSSPGYSVVPYITPIIWQKVIPVSIPLPDLLWILVKSKANSHLLLHSGLSLALGRVTWWQQNLQQYWGLLMIQALFWDQNILIHLSPWSPHSLVTGKMCTWSWGS